MRHYVTMRFGIFCFCFLLAHISFAIGSSENHVFLRNIGQMTDQYGKVRQDIGFQLKAC